MPRRTRTAPAPSFSTPFGALAAGLSGGYQGAQSQEEALQLETRKNALKQQLGIYQADRRFDASAYGTDAHTTETRDKNVSGYVSGVYGDLQKGNLTPGGFRAKIAAGAGVYGYDPSLYPLPDGGAPLPSPGAPSGLGTAPPAGLNFGLGAGPSAPGAPPRNMFGMIPGGTSERAASAPGVNPAASGAPPLGGPPPSDPAVRFLSPNAESVIGARGQGVTQHGQALASAFTAKLPTLMAAVGNLPHASQPAAVQSLISQGQALGVDVSSLTLPGQPTGQTRRRNYGLPPAQMSALDGIRAVLGRSNDPNASARFGGKTYNRGELARAFPDAPVPVLTPFYPPDLKTGSVIGANNARAAASTGGASERGRHNLVTEKETHLYHTGSLGETTRNHDLQDKSRGRGQDLQLYGRLAGGGGASGGKASASEINSNERLIAGYNVHKAKIIADPSLPDADKQAIIRGDDSQIISLQTRNHRLRSTVAPSAGLTPGVKGAASAFVGTYGGPNGCATTVCKIAARAGLPVPQTASAGEMERQLPSHGWQRVSGAPGPNDIVTMPGRGPSGRHVGWSNGDGTMTDDPGRRTGYSVTRSPIPAGATVWRHPAAQRAAPNAQAGTDARVRALGGAVFHPPSRMPAAGASRPRPKFNPKSFMP